MLFLGILPKKRRERKSQRRLPIPPAPPFPLFRDLCRKIRWEDKEPSAAALHLGTKAAAAAKEEEEKSWHAAEKEAEDSTMRVKKDDGHFYITFLHFRAFCCNMSAKGRCSCQTCGQF